MILDLERFISKEQLYWDELDRMLLSLSDDAGRRRSLEETRRFHYLYKRASADLARIHTFSGQAEIRTYLEQLVARAYIALHGEREKQGGGRVSHWLLREWPRTFRRHWIAFAAALAVSLAGAAFGGFVARGDPDSRQLLIPAQFSHVLVDPSERVELEEMAAADPDARASLAGQSLFAGVLIQNNVRVTIKAMAFGILYGVLTILLLFYNGIILGVVCFDYVGAGESEFLLAWLLPHGVPELTAIFMGGQAGLVLARAMFGWGSGLSLGARLRRVRRSLATIIGGCALMLIWAGVVEAFLSQLHEPVISYESKIAFGVLELVLMVLFFGFCGRRGAGADALAHTAPA